MIMEPLKMSYFSNYTRAEEELKRVGRTMEHNLKGRIDELPLDEMDPNERIRMAIEMYEYAKHTDGEIADFTSVFYLVLLMPKNLEEIKVADDIKESHPNGIPVTKTTVDEFLAKFCSPPDIIEGWKRKTILSQDDLDLMKSKVGEHIGTMLNSYNYTLAMIEQVEKRLGVENG